MRARFCLLVLASIACDGRLRSAQIPASTKPAGTAVDAATPTNIPDAAPGPRTLERWACQRTNGSVVFQHMANIELRDDGTFELHHTNASQHGGWMSWVQGTWQRDASATLILTPVTAMRRRWIGDGHRHAHGERTLYQETQETISTAPWRLRTEANGTLFISEVHTHVGQLTSGSEAIPCDDVSSAVR